MKIKTSLIIFSFITTFALALLCVGISEQTINKKNDNPQIKSKIYSFLLADKVRWNKWNDRSSALKLKNKTDALNELLQERREIMFELFLERANADTTELPSDLKEAWSNYLIGEKLILNLINQKSPQRNESIEDISERIQTFEKEYRNIVQTYGFDLNEANLIITEEN